MNTSRLDEPLLSKQMKRGDIVLVPHYVHAQRGEELDWAVFVVRVFVAVGDQRVADFRAVGAVGVIVERFCLLLDGFGVFLRIVVSVTLGIGVLAERE